MSSLGDKPREAALAGLQELSVRLHDEVHFLATHRAPVGQLRPIQSRVTPGQQVGEDKIVAPLPGTVVALLAEEGATLEKGAAILTLEVMKMEQTLRAPFAGVLKAIKCKVGDIVGEGVELAEVEPAAS